MDEMNVARFADELRMPVEVLLEQLNRAGVKKSRGEDTVTAQDKQVLLDFLRQSHGDGKRGKITLTRRQTSEIRAVDAATGKERTVQVEVRKKRTLVSREALAERAAAAAAAAVRASKQSAAEEPAVAQAPAPAPQPVAEPAPASPAAEPVRAEAPPEVEAGASAPQAAEAPEAQTQTRAPARARTTKAAAAPASRPVLKPVVLSEEERAARARESDRYHELRARQQADARARQEREEAARAALEARRKE
ncbi:MAG: translation initiation factor IF-2 associated domain-containing protein, partial [Rhodocyclaceae bacterium]|nr:translation initiation factor IF-2 associated domain-containing protein [Rhodocyclaceae bacterium]